MNKDFKVVKGVYPTMITPYKNGKIDEAGVRALVRFYWEKGCDGIFATCQSSEILFLSTEEKADKLTDFSFWLVPTIPTDEKREQVKRKLTEWLKEKHTDETM